MFWIFFLADVDFSHISTSDRTLKALLDPVLTPFGMVSVYFLIMIILFPAILFVKKLLQKGKLTMNLSHKNEWYFNTIGNKPPYGTLPTEIIRQIK